MAARRSRWRTRVQADWATGSAARARLAVYAAPIEALGMTVEAIARGRDGQFVPAGICWVVERSFAWLSRYRRLNTIFERSKEHLIAFIATAFISILSRRMKRLVTEELYA